MERIETPLKASILLDAFCCPITLTGNTELQLQSSQWLRESYFRLTKPSALFTTFFPLQKSFPGYDVNHIKSSSGIRTCAYFKPIDDQKEKIID
jgi:hypothetical protein